MALNSYIYNALHLNRLDRSFDTNGNDKLDGIAVEDYVQEQNNCFFNDFAFFSPYYDADLYVDNRGSQPKYAFVKQGQVLSVEQYVKSLPRNWEAHVEQYIKSLPRDLDTPVSQEDYKNLKDQIVQEFKDQMLYLHHNATPMSNDEIVDFVNAEYNVHNLNQLKTNYLFEMMMSGWKEEEGYRVDAITRKNPYPGDYNYNGYVLTNGAYVNMQSNEMRSPLQSYFMPGSNEYYNPVLAHQTFIDEGNIYWDAEYKEISLSAEKEITPYQKHVLETIVSGLSDDELGELVINVYAKDKQAIERYDFKSDKLISPEAERACEDITRLLAPNITGRQKDKDRDDFDGFDFR